MMASIYELTAEYMQLLEMAEDGDIDDAVFSDTLESITGDLEDKADSYAKVMKELQAKSDGLSGEIERLTNRKKSIENNIKRMKDALQNAMVVTGKTKFKTDLFSFGISKNPASVFIPDETNVPEQFLIPQPPKVDKKGIIDFLKGLDENDTCAWAELTQGEHLSIR